MNRALVAAAACVAAACGPSLMKLPNGAGTPVGPADAAAALTEATSACASVRTLTVEMSVGGSAGGRRLRARLSAGVAAPASIRLEAVAPFGEPLLLFAATGDDATLLLPRDGRALEHGRPDDVLEAAAGVPLGAADLAAILIGCVPPSSAAAPSVDAKGFGDTWLVIGRAGGDDLYLRRDAAARPWQLVAMTRRAAAANRRWRAEYNDRQDGIPRSIHVTSVDDSGRIGRAFDLQLALSQVEVNAALDAGAFTIQIPKAAVPITIGELSESGPLAPKSNGR